MRDDKSTVGKYATVLLLWLAPVALILFPLLYPTEGYVRETLVLPVIIVLLYIAMVLAPLVRPWRNLDFFDDIPEVVERYADAQRARKDARGLIRLYDGGRLPNVYELTNLTPFQQDVKRIVDVLRSDADWHSGNAEVSRDILEQMEALMHAAEEEPEDEAPTHQRKKGSKRR